MNKASQIKTHFDSKVLVFFMTIFVFSCLVLIYKIKTGKNCNLTGFKIESKSLKAKELITFSDTTKKSSDWIWDFGDGSDVSYLSKAGHFYEKEGTYVVKLKVDNSCTVEQVINVLPFEEKFNGPVPNFSCPKTVFKGSPVTFTDLTAGAKSWEWMFGESIENGNFESTKSNPSYTYTSTGIKKVKLAVNGDYKHVKIVEIEVIEPAIKKAAKTGIDVVIKAKGPIRKGVTESDIEDMLNAVSINKLEYRRFSEFFCKSYMPDVHLKDGHIVSLKELVEDVKDKKRLKIKSVKIETDQDGCVFRIDISYKY